MLSLKEIEESLKDRNLSEVGRRTELPPSTVWRIANGQGATVEYRSIEKVSNYLEGKSV
jgi:hypothetical protein